MRSVLSDQNEPQKTKVPKTTITVIRGLNKLHDMKCDPRHLADSDSESSKSSRATPQLHSSLAITPY
jgi:hypothetical protein